MKEAEWNFYKQNDCKCVKTMFVVGEKSSAWNLLKVNNCVGGVSSYFSSKLSALYIYFLLLAFKNI